MLAFDVVRRPWSDSDMLRRLINCRIIIIIIIFNPRKKEGGQKIKKSRKRFEVEN